MEKCVKETDRDIVIKSEWRSKKERRKKTNEYIYYEWIKHAFKRLIRTDAI